MQHDTTNGRTDGRTYLKALNARVLVTLLVCATVVLAGCTGVSDLTGGSNDGVAASGGGSGNGGAGGSGNGNGGSDGNSGNDGARDSNGGSSADSVGESVNTTDWLNFSEPGRHYVFEFSSAENGSGELVVDTTEENIRVQAEKGVLGPEAVDRTIPRQGDDATALGSTDTASNGEALTDTDIANSLDGISYILTLLSSVVVATIGEDAVEVGYSGNGTEITGMGSYAGIECYETTYEDSTGALSTDVCLVPGEAAPHAIIYNATTGEVDSEITLKEYDRE